MRGGIVWLGAARFVEKLDEPRLIEAQIGGVGAHDAALIGKGREIVERFVFERGQIMAIDPDFLLSLTKGDALSGHGLVAGCRRRRTWSD